jgi:hypothetical protein
LERELVLVVSFAGEQLVDMAIVDEEVERAARVDEPVFAGGQVKDLIVASVFPTRLDKGFGVGLTLRPLFGVGILVGLSLFKSTELGDGVTANPGDTWNTADALPCG